MGCRLFQSHPVLRYRKGQEGYLLSMKTALANDLSRFKEVIVRLERSDMAYTADKVVELFSSPADCGGFVSFTW